MIVYSVIICTCRIVFCKLYKFHIISVCVLDTQSCLSLVIPWTVACQAPLSMEFSSQGYRSGLPFHPPSYYLCIYYLGFWIEGYDDPQNDATRTILSILSSISQKWFALLALTRTMILYRCLMDALGIWHSRFLRVLPGILFQILISFELLLEFANFFWIYRAFFLQFFCSEICPSNTK